MALMLFRALRERYTSSMLKKISIGFVICILLLSGSLLRISTLRHTHQHGDIVHGHHHGVHDHSHTHDHDHSRHHQHSDDVTIANTTPHSHTTIFGFGILWQLWRSDHQQALLAASPVGPFQAGTTHKDDREQLEQLVVHTRNIPWVTPLLVGFKCPLSASRVSLQQSSRLCYLDTIVEARFQSRVDQPSVPPPEAC